MERYANTLITGLQAMQLVALAPCVFVILFLLLTARDVRLVAVPCLYFAALAAGFLLPLVDSGQGGAAYGVLMFAASLVPALSFLLILQFAGGAAPRPVYWLILALPLLGGSGMVYATLLSHEVCLRPDTCLPSADIEGLYATFSNAFIFLLLVAVFARTRRAARDTERMRNEYWLIVSLIGLNLLSMAVGLARLQGALQEGEALFIHTVLRMTFIYVVLTLLFRVFDGPRTMVREAVKPSPEQERRDRDIAAAFEALMEERHCYREMGCSREWVAREIGVKENRLSRVVNQHYDARFTDIVNRYRVKEAQRLLIHEPDRPVTDIAFEVGFNSIPSFNRVFKAHCGFSPSAFRAVRQDKRRV